VLSLPISSVQSLKDTKKIVEILNGNIVLAAGK
jgi:hypothetical protein